MPPKHKKRAPKKDQGKADRNRKQEPSLADSSTWRERKPLTPYSDNATSSTPTVLKRPVPQEFGPSWLQNTGSSNDGPCHNKGSKLSHLQVLIPVPDAKNYAESVFNVKINNDLSLLKCQLELKDETELPQPKTNISPMERLPQGYLHYFTPWNARNYAHKIKSNFQSFNLACYDLHSVGIVDFITDVENLKKIMQIKKSTQYESFICHRLGNTVLVDRFDLQSLYWKSKNSFWPWFENYARQYIGDTNTKQVKEQHSYSKIRNMEALHVLFYHCVKNLVPVEQKLPEDTEDDKFKRNAIPMPENENDNFLRRYAFTIDKFVSNLGSSIPVFFKNDSKVILRTYNGANSRKISQSELIDIYVEQLILGADKTYLAHHDDMVLKKSEWVCKNTIFSSTKLTLNEVITDGISMLQMLKDKVVSPSHSYWLFKAPGRDVALVDLNAQMKKDKDGGCSPFGICYASLLYRVCHTFLKVKKTDVALSMLNHAEFILQENYKEIPPSVLNLKRYYSIRQTLREKRPEISEPKDEIHKDFDYQWEKEVLPIASTTQ